MTSDPSIDRTRLFPDGIDQVQLYHSPEQLALAIGHCRQDEWDVVDLDAGGWADGDALHDDLSSALNFPSYYGRNLDALHDMMMEIGRNSSGFSPTAPGGVLVLRHLDRFVAANRSRAEAVVDILASASARALQYGWPLAILLQSDDRQLRLPPMATIHIGWSTAERSE